MTGRHSESSVVAHVVSKSLLFTVKPFYYFNATSSADSEAGTT